MTRPCDDWARNLKRLNQQNCNDSGCCHDNNYCPKVVFKLVFEFKHALAVDHFLRRCKGRIPRNSSRHILLTNIRAATVRPPFYFDFKKGKARQVAGFFNDMSKEEIDGMITERLVLFYERLIASDQILPAAAIAEQAILGTPETDADPRNPNVT